jgi:uncharacterized protein (TIGR03435 family)
MRIAAGWLVAAVCAAQPPTFEAVSVKAVNLATHPTFGNSGGPGTTGAGRIHLCCVGMYSLLMRAYNVQIDQIRGPAWLMENMGPNLYQVDATMPPNTTRAQFQLMMQAMLVERFHLSIHHETRNFPGYDLVIAKDGPKLQESKPDPDTPAQPMSTSLGHGMVRVRAQQKPLHDLVSAMGSLIDQSNGADLRDFASPKPRVLDQTGLTGTYDFTLEFACESCQNLGANLPMAGGGANQPTPVDPAGSGLPNIFAALEKQLGLKLVKTSDITLDVIVVDRVDKVPTEN